MTDNSTPSFETMLDVLERNPLKAIQLAGKAHRGVNRLSWEVAGIACGFARILKDDPKHRDDFYDEEFFDLKRLHPDKLLLHVFAYLYGSLRGPAYNRASEHARALKKVCDDRDIEVADIPQYIADHGGFDGLLNEREDQEDDQRDDQEDGSDAAFGDGGRKPRVTRRPTEPDATLTADDGGLDDEDLIAEATEEEGPFVPPQRKAIKPEASEPKLALLPRELIAAYMLVRPRAPLKMEDIWRALKKGKKVNADLAMGETSASHELYTGGGPFIDVYVEEMVTS